ncbi:MAG TPA: ABC transporter substrate-binding protein [Solirubrobacterales bacterium]|nr:ABC transporter substrate-binding protein [Solirubrobacterales bacterium]
MSRLGLHRSRHAGTPGWKDTIVPLTVIRAVLALALSLLAATHGADAQTTAKIARLGVLLFSTPEGDPNLAAFRRRLGELGYVEGTNLTTVYRSAEGKPERLAELARELVALKPDVIFAMGGDVAPFARTATNSIPIVMAVSNDPVRAGLVSTLARPGGNMTGVTFISSELVGKRLQFLKEAAPRISRVAVLWNPDHVDPEYAETHASGRTLGVHVQSLEVRGPPDFEGAFQAADEGRAEAVIVVSSRLMTFSRQRIIELAARRRLPVVSGWGPWAQAGALLSYGPDLDASVHRAAAHVDRVLKGAAPATLAVEQPTKFELVINLRVATALGLTIPPSLRAQATRIIE